MDPSIEVYHSPFYPDFHIIWHFRSVDWMLLISGAWISVFLCEPIGLLVAAFYIPVWQNRFWSPWWRFLRILIYVSSVQCIIRKQNLIFYMAAPKICWVFFKLLKWWCFKLDDPSSSKALRYPCRQTGRREIKDLIIGCILLLHRKWLELDLPSFDHFIGNFHGKYWKPKGLESSSVDLNH